MGEIAAEAVDACRFVQKSGLGTVHRCVPLKGEWTLPSGQATQPWLCQTALGVWIAGAVDDVGKVLDLLAAHPSSYEERLLGDRLTAGLLSFSVPYGKGSDARDAIALGRLLRDATHPVYSDLPKPAGPWVEDTTGLEQVWMAAQLAPEDPILAWLHTSTPAQLAQAIAAGPKATWRLLITRDRTLLVAISRLGDVGVLDLPCLPLEVIEQTGRNEVVCGDFSWQTTLTNGNRFLWIATLTGLSGEARLREAARLAAKPRAADGYALAERLLSTLHETTGPLDALFRATLEARELSSKANSGRPTRTEEELDAICRDAVRALRAESSDSTALADWLLGWTPPIELANAVLEACLVEGDTGPESAWSLDYHHALRNRVVGESTDRFERTEADISLAEHLLYAGQNDDALRLLEPRLASLPDEDLAAVLPPLGADLTSGEGGQPAHIRVLELLVLARGGPERADVSALASLARHQPLVRQRLVELVEATAGGNLGHRAARALQILDPGGLSTPPVFAPSAGRGLSPEMVETVRHPVAREDGALARVQAALAKVQPPDFGVLRRYCERLHERNAPLAVNAVADACVLLGMPAVPAFVSVGERQVGVRSHEQPEPFLLIGGAHLDPASGLYMAEPELRFAIGCEVAHLRFQHSRITSDEIWAGVWDKGAMAITATASILPFLRFLPVDLIGHDRTYRAVKSVVPESWLRAIYKVDDVARLAAAIPSDLGRLGEAGAGALEAAKGAADRVQSAGTWMRGAPPAQIAAGPLDLSPDDARLIAAHRVMQITADRAGLLLCGDLGAAVRAMFLLQTRLLPELTVAERIGLDDALRRRDGNGHPVLPDLTVRIAALTAFWLSDDYARLRGAMGALDHLPIAAPLPPPPLEPEEVAASLDVVPATEPEVPATEPEAPTTEPEVPATEPKVPATEE